MRGRTPDGGWLSYEVKAGQQGPEVVAYRESAGARGQRSVFEDAQYDAALRPLARIFPDGTKVEWTYTNSYEQETVTSPGGDQYETIRSLDGRTAFVMQGDQLLWQETWGESGLLDRVADETVAIYPQRTQGAALSSLVFAPPDEDLKALKRWLEVAYDGDGHPTKVTDFTGSALDVRYDARGDLAQLKWNRGQIALRRAPDGRIQSVETSWGDRASVQHDGARSVTELVSRGASAKVQSVAGRVTRVTDYDGGVTTAEYYDDKVNRDRPKRVALPGRADVRFEYADDRLKTMAVGRRYRLELAYDPAGRITNMRQVPAGAPTR